MISNTITIQNLKCGGCAKTIVAKLSELPNIANVTIDQETSSVSFHSSDTEGIEKAKEKLKAIGYPSADEENTVLSKAKSFVSCASGKLAK